MPQDMQHRPIGVLRTRFTTPSGTPIQAAFAPDQPARLELDPDLVPGLQDLDGDEHDPVRPALIEHLVAHVGEALVELVACAHRHGRGPTRPRTDTAADRHGRGPTRPRTTAGERCARTRRSYCR